GDTPGVDAELRGIARRPLERGVAVLRAGRKEVLRREPVVDGDGDAACGAGGPETVQVLGVEVTHVEGAPVEEHETRCRFRTRCGGAVDAQRHALARGARERARLRLPPRTFG